MASLYRYFNIFFYKILKNDATCLIFGMPLEKHVNYQPKLKNALASRIWQRTCKQIIVDNNTCFYQLFWYLKGFKKIYIFVYLCAWEQLFTFLVNCSLQRRLLNQSYTNRYIDFLKAYLKGFPTVSITLP